MTHSSTPSFYPLSELKRARDDFAARWHNAMRFDPRLRDMHEQHYRFPPSIRMTNCTEYPFEQEDTMSQMPPVPSHSNVTSPQLPKIPGPRVRYQVDCKKLTEAIFSPQPTKMHCSVDEIPPSFFVCDNCPSTFGSQLEADKHLKEQQHISCSSYSTIPDLENDNSPMVVLRQPRVIYNGLVPSFNWLSDTMVVLCPSCHLILPDKLMCAYHHQSQHDGHLSNYAFGSVLCVRELNITRTLTCPKCIRSFDTQGSFLDHWIERNFACSSPFLPLQSDTDSKLSVRVVQVYCHICRAYFDRVTPPAALEAFNSITGSLGHKRRHPDETALSNSPQQPASYIGRDNGLNALVSWADGFARFCVNHACIHLAGGMIDDRIGCKLHIRVVQVDKNATKTLPPYHHESDLALLLFSIHECKRLVTFLRHMSGTRRCVQRRTRADLKRLLTLAETYGA